MKTPDTLTDAARTVLGAPEPDEKVRLTRAFAEAWKTGAITAPGAAQALGRPARPARPVLCSPRDMPKRSKAGTKGRAAFFHAIAHIELNAIDLGWDIIARFTSPDLPKAFYDDWVQVALDEAEHFAALDALLRTDLDCAYGDLIAHDGLWEAAETTADDLLARLALVPMVLEARGLDTTPAAVARLTANGDAQGAALLAKIGREEEPHVAAGVRWFNHVCGLRGLDPVPTFQALVRARYNGMLKPPFNTAARSRAGFDPAFYEPLGMGGEAVL